MDLTLNGGQCYTLSGNAGRTVVIIKRADYISDDPTPKIGGGVALTLKAERRGCIITYQTVAGTLNPGGHPGSYNWQDAYNDMLVIDDERTNMRRISTGECWNHEGGVPYAERKP